MSIDLGAFCAHQDDPRADLHKPWFDGGWIAASDGAVIVALSAMDAPEVPAASEKRRGSVDRFISATVDQLQAVDIVFPGSQGCTCEACGGTGYTLSVKCSICFGEGEFERGSHTYMCKSCDGEGLLFRSATAADAGAVRCDECNGLGVESRPIQVGAAWFQEKYLRRIAALPNLSFFPPPDEDTMAKFVFDGGVGFLMPYRQS